MTLRKMISKILLFGSLMIGFCCYSNNIFADGLASLKTEQNVIQNNNKANQVNHQKATNTKQQNSEKKKYQLQQSVITPQKHKKCSKIAMIGIIVGVVLVMYIVFGPIGGLI